MVASGFAGLGYQIIWTQEFALCLGTESASVLAVVAAFFAGLAVGALAFGSRVEASAHPQRWYAAAEALTATWGLLLAVTMAPVGGIVLRVIGTNPPAVWQWSVAFVSTFVILLPATAAMGVTLPAMERAVAAQAREGRSIAGLYAANTAGAVIGVLAIALWLIPSFGLLRASCVCAVFNLAGCDHRRACLGCARSQGSRDGTADRREQRRALWRLATTGFLGIGFEILVVRVLSQVTEDTVYTFALLLALYLVGTCAWRVCLLARRSGNVLRLRNLLLVVLGLACLLSTGLLYGSEHLRDWLLQWSGGGFRPALAAEGSARIDCLCAANTGDGRTVQPLVQ